MDSSEPRFLLLVNPTDPERTVFVVRFFLPDDRFQGPAAFHPVLMATRRLHTGRFDVECSHTPVDVAALQTANPGFPVPRRRRGADQWPAYWASLLDASVGADALEELVDRAGAMMSVTQILYFGPSPEMVECMPSLELHTGSMSLLAAWIASIPSPAALRTSSFSFRPSPSPSVRSAAPSVAAASSSRPRSPIMSVGDLTPPGAAAAPPLRSVTMPSRPGSWPAPGATPMLSAGLRFGDIEVDAPFTTTSPHPPPVSEPRVVSAHAPTPVSGMATPLAAEYAPLASSVRTLHRSAKTPRVRPSLPPPVPEPATAASFHTARDSRTPALSNRFAALAVADADDPGESSSSSSASLPASPSRRPLHSLDRSPGLPPSRPRPAAPPSLSHATPVSRVGAPATTAVPARAPSAPSPSPRRNHVADTSRRGAAPADSLSPSSSSSSSSEPDSAFGRHGPARDSSSSSSRRSSRRRLPARRRPPRSIPPAAEDAMVAAAPGSHPSGLDARLLSVNARQAVQEISDIKWNGRLGRDAYVWIAELRLALESRVVSDDNPTGIWSSFENAFSACRTIKWFPDGSEYRFIFRQPTLTWASFEASCKLHLYRQFDHADFKADLQRFTWDFPTQPLQALADLEVQNNYLPPHHRLAPHRLRRIWGKGCRTTEWRFVLEDLHFPQYGDGTTYRSRRVSIDEIIRALDARGLKFGQPSSLALTPASAAPPDPELAARLAAVERQLNRRGTSRLNLVAFSKDVRDAYNRPLQRPSPSSSHQLKKTYISQVLTAAREYVSCHPELHPEFDDTDTYELQRLLDSPAPADYDPGPLHVTIAESNGSPLPQYRPGFPGPRDNRDRDRDRGSWSRNHSRDRGGFQSNRPPSRPPSPGGPRPTSPSASSSSHAGTSTTASSGLSHS
ncbi:hypothetical protein HDU96_002615, partial [Phlyctochytrium bullatum]